MRQGDTVKITDTSLGFYIMHHTLQVEIAGGFNCHRTHFSPVNFTDKNILLENLIWKALPLQLFTFYPTSNFKKSVWSLKLIAGLCNDDDDDDKSPNKLESTYV